MRSEERTVSGYLNALEADLVGHSAVDLSERGQRTPVELRWAGGAKACLFPVPPWLLRVLCVSSCCGGGRSTGILPV